MPNMKPTPRALSVHPSASRFGSLHVSWLIMRFSFGCFTGLLMSEIVWSESRSLTMPPWQQNILCSMMAASGMLLKLLLNAAYTSKLCLQSQIAGNDTSWYYCLIKSSHRLAGGRIWMETPRPCTTTERDTTALPGVRRSRSDRISTGLSCQSDQNSNSPIQALAQKTVCWVHSSLLVVSAYQIQFRRVEDLIDI